MEKFKEKFLNYRYAGIELKRFILNELEGKKFGNGIYISDFCITEVKDGNAYSYEDSIWLTVDEWVELYDLYQYSLELPELAK